MANPKLTIEDKIVKQQAAVEKAKTNLDKAKASYDKAVASLDALRQKQKEQETSKLFDALKESGKSVDDILKLINDK